MRFFALELSLEVVRKLRVLVPAIRVRDRKLFSQICTAASSISLNLGEGSRRKGQDRKHFWRIASGSAEEVRTALRVAVAWGYFAGSKVEDLLTDIDKLQAILWRLGE